MDILKIRHDDDPLNPRKEFDNVGTMACWHGRYILGDVQPKEPPGEWLKEHAPEGSVKLPLFLIDHSGISMRTHDFSDCDPGHWDSGQVGWIVVTPYKMGTEIENPVTDATREKAKKILQEEVKIYDQYLRGDSWGYIFRKAKPACEKCGHVEYEEDSCWGFLGDTLEETALETEVPEAAKPLLAAAWDARS
jgi:hypothetical protein